jgi:Fe-S-cluster containining protein
VTLKQLEYLQINHPEILNNLEKDATNNNSIIQQQMRMANNSYGLPCPLLSIQTGTCSVYNVRPLICRMHGSTHFSQHEYEV